ncbi:DoxX family protein [Streptomyces decoyicus]|uniref:DoxX family protein n=1 Tax=Streptomyces decoyicus TaxID=249567 RepID=UPI0004AA3074|nr:DoxX family protein [Streptomyces decoyicus]KOG41092.1 membrane protein [Streptomyces decoyicus]QZY19982.1 DoxX family protein [Streptomyces decoyicus]
MSTAYVVVTLLAAVMAGFSAASVFFRAKWVVQPMADYGIPGSWLPWLGTAKAAGAAGLLAGLFLPMVGVAAGIGLVLYFAGAVVAVVRARWYAHILFPLLYAAPVIGALVLGFTA